ncbi:MAG: MMPL family transporter [Thermodesulfovibrionales bacterium]|nr:MMPL family transporter [Thermodesulfovibrionales bacterium]
MRKFSLVEVSVNHPKLVVILSIIITLAFMTQFPKMKTDTNPKHMLPDTSDVRVWNDEVDKTFALYEDMIVLGIVNEKSVLNKETLRKIQRITDEILRIKGVAARDVNSFPTITNVTAEKGALRVAPLMIEVPKTDKEIGYLRKMLFENPLFINRIISKDEKTTAIYVPLEKGANGKEVADKIRDIVKKEKGDEKYYVAGDPVARDTFGSEMFKLMAVFAPIAGMVMLIVRYLMFRDLFLSVALMMDAMMSIVWSMGMLIALGFPIHIMSSMAPVFLMAIATDSIHIFNEFYFRYKEKRDKKAAIIETMHAVGRPVRYTALATAAGFAVLLFMNIVPVKVFGGLVAFGAVMLRVLSFSFIPAMFMFVKESNIEKAAMDEDIETSGTARFLKGLAGLGARKPKTVVLAGIALFIIAAFGISKTVVNNNMVDWFKEKSDIRVADSVMNRALGGTSLGYIVATSQEENFIKTPEAMRYIDGLQRHIEKLSVVGKTTSVVDYVKRINRVLHDDDPQYDSVPDSKDAIGQYLFLFSMSAKPADLDNVIDYQAAKANIWLQLKTWDAQAMRDVIAAVNEYKKANPMPMDLKPAGTAYFNLVWNEEVLWDMVKGFIIALIVVFVILRFNFHSFRWAFVGYIPLVFTITLIYGVIGFMGKDFDMPISVLSTLSLGMAVDFAIHFISRFKQRLKESSELGVQSPEKLKTLNSELITQSLLWTAARPGKGIMLNAVLFASAFSVMLFAPLTPYITVGAFIVSMMLLSAVMTIIYIPALITLLQRWLIKGGVR